MKPLNEIKKDKYFLPFRGDHFIYNYINPQFLEKQGHIFNDNQYEIMRKNNFDIFPEKLAEIYRKNDLSVASTGIPVDVIEEAMDAQGNTVYFKVMKWREIKDKKDTLV